MYLFNLDTLGYVVITLLLASLFLVSYINRRKNNSSNEFLGIGGSPKIKLIKDHFGLVEFVIFTTLGAKFGFGGFYYLAIAVIIANLLWIRYDTNINYSTFATFVRNKSNLTLSIIIAFYQILAYLCLTIITIIIMASICKSLLGWSFVNSVLGLIGFTVVYIFVGGYKAVKINKIINYSTFFVIIFITIGFIAYQSKFFIMIINNLEQLAVSQSLNRMYYLSFIANATSARVIAVLFVWVIGLSILYNKVGTIRKAKLKFTNLILKLSLILSVVFIGICALGTNAQSVAIKGKEIVTYQAQLANGEIGYIVKAVSHNGESSTNMGILPPQINPQNTQVEPNSYNYLLSGVVTLKHYLPSSLYFLIFVGLMVLFIVSLSQYLIHSSRIIVKNIAIPLKIFDKYGDTGMLWLSRMSIILMVFVAVIIAYFALPYFNFINAMMLFLAIFMTPLFIVLILLSFLNSK